jgi:hypothetical protein
MRTSTGPRFAYFNFDSIFARSPAATEIDMRLEDLLVEAKLTESDFQSAKVAAGLRQTTNGVHRRGAQSH